MKGTVSSHFSPSFIVVKNVFDANVQVLLLLFLCFPVYATDITGTICISLFLLLCFTSKTHQNMHKKMSIMNQSVQTYLSVSIKTKGCECRILLLCALNLMSSSSEICLRGYVFCQVLTKLCCLDCLAEIPKGAVCNISQACANSFIKQLLKKQMWHEVLLLLTGKASGEETLGGGLFKTCSLSDVDIGSVIQQCDGLNEQIYLIRCLIENGGEKLQY